MAEEQMLLSYPELIESLREACLGDKTGTWNAATADNRSIRIGIDSGTITHVVFQALRGKAALARIRQVSGGRCGFRAGLLPEGGRDPQLPETHRILDYLASGGGSGAASSGGKSGVSVARLKAVIQEEATEFLGPMGPTVCDEHFEATGDLSTKAGLVRVLAGVAREIGDPQKGAAFKNRVLTRLTSRNEAGSP